MSTPENSSSDPRPTSRMETSRMDSPGREGQEPGGPQEPVHTRFKRFRDTSQPERRRPPRPQSRKEEDTGEEATEEEATEKETADDEEGGSIDAKGAGTEAVGDEAVRDEAESGDRWDEVIGLYEEGNRKQARLLAARLAMDERTFATPPFSKELYVLDRSTMTYGPGGEEALNSLLLRKLKAFHSRREVREIANKIRARLYEKDFRKAKAIPLANGDLSVRSMKLREPSPEGHFLVRSESKWDPEADCPAFRRFLRAAVPDRADRQVLQNYTGYCLLHWDRPFRRVLLLAGPEGSGRETFLQALSTAVPWTASVAPRHLARGKAGASKLKGPWVNAKADISTEALPELPLLRRFSEGTPSYDDPGQIESAKQGGRSHRTTKHVYATGELPPLAAGDQFFRRVLLVSFPKKLSASGSSPGAAEPDLRQKLLEERDGIFQWAAEGLRRVLRAQASGKDFPSARPAEKTRQQWERLSGPIGRFKADRLEVTGDPQDVVSKKTLYHAYENFCKQERVFTETKTQLTQTLTEDPRVESRRRTVEQGGDQIPCYVGVKLTG